MTNTHPAVITFYATNDSELDNIVRWEASKTAPAADEILSFTGEEKEINIGHYARMLPFEDGVLKPSELVASDYCNEEVIEDWPNDERMALAFLLRQGYKGIVTVTTLDDKHADSPRDGVVSAYPFPDIWGDDPAATATMLATQAYEEEEAE